MEVAIDPNAKEDDISKDSRRRTRFSLVDVKEILKHNRLKSWRNDECKQRTSGLSGKSLAYSPHCVMSTDEFGLDMCPSENKVALSLSISDAALESPSDLEVAAFALLLRDTCNALELLRRSICSQHEEPQPAASCRRVFAPAADQCDDKLERSLLFGFDAGFLPVVPSQRTKMMNDRDLVVNVFRAVACDLAHSGSYNQLRSEVNSIIENKERECSVVVNLKIWSDLVTTLRESLVTFEEKFKAQKETILEDIARLSEEISVSFCANNDKLDYVRRWEASKLEQQNLHQSDKEQAKLDEITELENSRITDAKVSLELQAFCKATLRRCEAEISVWSKRYNNELERRQQESNDLQEKIEKIQEFIEESRELYAERQIVIDEYMAEKKKIQDEIDYWEDVNTSATKIQAIWKGYMVRHFLGPYKFLAKKPKKKSKSANKGKKKKK